MVDKTTDFISSREAAKLLGVAVSTIQTWTNNGLLRAWTTAGGHRRIVRSSVDDILNQQQSASIEPASDNQLSVVIVEDEHQQLLLNEKLINSLKMNTHIIKAENGYEGLIKIGNTIPDVIITDLMMPHMDGFQMVRALKTMPELKHSLIVVISGLTESEIKEKGGLPEGIHFFQKPINIEDVKKFLQQKLLSKSA